MSAAFTERELKLVRLFLDPAASAGEIRNAATKFAESLRNRKVQAETIAAFEGALSASKPSPVRYSRPDYGRCRMPFGRNKGKPFTDIEPSYLQFILSWIRANTQAPAFHRRLAENIESFFSR